MNAFPYINGDTVTEATARICATKGHATYSQDGAMQNVCPRCGERTLIDATPLRLISILRTYRGECIGAPSVAPVETQMWLYAVVLGTMKSRTRKAYLSTWRHAIVNP